MAAREGGGHPFNWFIIGFVVGVAAALAALLYLGVRRDGGSEGAETRPPEPAPAIAAPKPVIPALPAAPPASAKKPVTPPVERPRVSQRESDEQMAEDAAAAGMTSRTKPGQAAPDQQ
jgi:hypothetical protein